jgi:hypothetical protein
VRVKSRAGSIPVLGIMKKIQVQIIREDIEQGQWHAHYCPEALAIKRALTENGIHWLAVHFMLRERSKNSPLIRGGPRLYLYYGILDKDKDCLRTHKTRAIKIPQLIDWSVGVEKAMKECWQSGICFQNTHFLGSDRSLTPEFAFELNIPDSILKADDVGDICILESEVVTRSVINGISDLRLRSEILGLWANNSNVFVEMLQQGSMARYNFYKREGRYREVKMVADSVGCFVKAEERDEEVLVSTYEYSKEELKVVIDSAMLEHCDKPNFEVILAIREVVFQKIEAGILYSYN